MAKAWKNKAGANTRVCGRDRDVCKNTSCPHRATYPGIQDDYKGCLINRNYRHCELFHIKPKRN